MSPPAPYLVDEILEEIFLRLPTPSALARASTACFRFRRIITGGSFLRLYRKLHPPPLLGFAGEGGFHPAEAPHPSAPLARALADAADFTFSFVPKPRKGDWKPHDVRDGRVLLQDSGSGYMLILAVCDPLSRRYVLIPPIPEDLAVEEEKLVEIQSMLAPVGEDEDDTSFKVICPACYENKLVAFVFSSVTAYWCIAASLSWSSLGTVQPENTLIDYNHLHGCFYWTGLWSQRDKLLVLDTRSMEFFTINFLSGYHTQPMNQPDLSCCNCSIVAGRGEEDLEVFSLVTDQSTIGSLAVHHSVKKNNGKSSMEWQLEKIIPLPGKYCGFTSGAADGFLFLRALMYTEDELNINNSQLRISSEEHIFSLEVRTSETTTVYRKTPLCNPDRIYSYFGFPPSLSKPTI